MNRPIRVVLVRPRNPGNIGACARALANFGLRDLVLADPYVPIVNEAKSAPGAEAIVQEARIAATWEEAVKDCRLILGTSSFHQRPFEHAVIELPNLEKYLSSYPPSEPLALIFGSERSGLSNEELSRCQAIIHIPTQKQVPSMNLGQAVAIVLYELRRSAWEPGPKDVPAHAQELEPLIETLVELGTEHDYPRGFAREERLGRIRQALHDAVLPPATVRFLLSFMRWLKRKRPTLKT